MSKVRDHFITAAYLGPLVMVAAMLGKAGADHIWPGPPDCRPCPECKACAECPGPGDSEYPKDDFPPEDWVCVTTQEDFELMMWATGLEESAIVYEDVVAEQREEIEWWRSHCDYEAAKEHRDVQVKRDLNEVRKRMRLKAAERALEERMGATESTP